MKVYISEGMLFEGLSDDVLYHGTPLKNLEEIKKYGLLPDFGETVRGTEMYQYYVDDDYFDPDDRVEGVLFFGDSPDVWTYSHFREDESLDKALLVVVKKNDSIFQKRGFDFFDIRGNKVDSINYIDVDKLPPFIEDGDYFSFEEQEPIELLYGERLKNFLEDYK